MVDRERELRRALARLEDADQTAPPSALDTLGAALEQVLDVLELLGEDAPTEQHERVSPHLEEARRLLSDGWRQATGTRPGGGAAPPAGESRPSGSS